MADLDYGKTIRVYAGHLGRLHRGRRRRRASASRTPRTQRRRNAMADLQSFVRRFSANASKSKQATSAPEADRQDQDRRNSSRRSRQYPWIRFEYDPKEKLHRQAVELENVTCSATKAARARS
jgi:ATPase subunit of ABC transporter with duplicated ATPase domains